MRSLLLPLALAIVACSGSTTQDVLLVDDAGGGGGSSGSSGSSSDGGSTTPANCPQEREPNDVRAAANTLTGSICGTLDPGSETDIVTFQVDASVKSLSLTFEGKVKLKVEVEGKPAVELTPQTNAALPFVAGKPYYVEIRDNGGGAKTTAWRVNLTTR